MSCSAPLVDAFNRRISYLRLSVTDRCDLRCSYCMPEKMQFLPRKEVLSLEELHTLALAVIDRGISKIRLTGGEPRLLRGVVTPAGEVGRCGYADQARQARAQPARDEEHQPSAHRRADQDDLSAEPRPDDGDGFFGPPRQRPVG